MKKIISALVLVILIAGSHVCIAGDLIVNGKLGVGTDSPLSAQINVESTDEAATNVQINKNANTSWINGFKINLNSNTTDASAIGLFVGSSANAIGATTGRLQGSVFKTLFRGSGTLDSTIAFSNQIHLATSSGNYTIDEAIAQQLLLWKANPDIGNHTLTNFYGLHSKGANYSGAGSINGTNWRHAYFEDFPDFYGTVTNVAGLWIDQQTAGTNNYGIVLKGDGAIGDYGAALVLGANQNAYVYGKSDGVYVYDGTDETKISPHDPETGEWIYYSKNTKTGVVKRVNMEKLVKAVEQLTGEQFLFESLEE